MSAFRIFCDVRLNDEDLAFLQADAAPHEIILPQRPVGSVLSQGEGDPGFLVADIAVGQPNTASVLSAPHLRWVQVTSAGITRYDTPEFRAAAKEKGLAVSNSSDVYAEACAEHTLAFMLAQSRSLPTGLADRSHGGTPTWDKLRQSCRTLKGKSVVILGYGYIAERLIEMLAPFQMTISAFRRKARGDERVPIVSPEDLPAALAEADHVIDILPDNAESRHFVSETLLAQTKAGAIFYNIGRGATVDQDALAAALHSGHLGAAWLDVTEPEPLPDDHPLRHEPRCFITPHVAGGHENETRSLLMHFLQNLKRFEQSEPLRNRVM